MMSSIVGFALMIQALGAQPTAIYLIVGGTPDAMRTPGARRLPLALNEAQAMLGPEAWRITFLHPATGAPYAIMKEDEAAIFNCNIAVSNCMKIYLSHRPVDDTFSVTRVEAVGHSKNLFAAAADGLASTIASVIGCVLLGAQSERGPNSILPCAFVSDNGHDNTYVAICENIMLASQTEYSTLAAAAKAWRRLVDALDLSSELVSVRIRGGARSLRIVSIRELAIESGCIPPLPIHLLRNSSGSDSTWQSAMVTITADGLVDPIEMQAPLSGVRLIPSDGACLNKGPLFDLLLAKSAESGDVFEASCDSNKFHVKSQARRTFSRLEKVLGPIKLSGPTERTPPCIEFGSATESATVTAVFTGIGVVYSEFTLTSVRFGLSTTLAKVVASTRSTLKVATMPCQAATDTGDPPLVYLCNVESCGLKKKDIAAVPIVLEVPLPVCAVRSGTLPVALREN